jgi:hypothetical protein
MQSNISWGIEKVRLEDAFLSWMGRLRQCGSTAGEHVEEKVLSEYNFSALVSS